MLVLKCFHLNDRFNFIHFRTQSKFSNRFFSPVLTILVRLFRSNKYFSWPHFQRPCWCDGPKRSKHEMDCRMRVGHFFCAIWLNTKFYFLGKRYSTNPLRKYFSQSKYAVDIRNFKKCTTEPWFAPTEIMKRNIALLIHQVSVTSIFMQFFRRRNFINCTKSIF